MKTEIQTENLNNDDDKILNELQIREKYGYNKEDKVSLQLRIQKTFECNATKVKNGLIGMLPIITMVTTYKIKKYIPGDVISGLTVAVVRIPQSLAYGMLAGLNPINGMYTAFISPLVYVMFGTSKHLSVGTFSVVSLMVGTALDKALVTITPCPTVSNNVINITSSITTTTASTIATQLTTLSDKVSSDAQNLAIVCSLTLLIGVILLILGILQLGFVSVFLSDPLVSGFTTASAIYVMTAQLKSMVGVPVQRRSGPMALIFTYVELFSNLYKVVWAEVIISVICLVILVPLKHVNRTYKKQLRNIPIPVELIVVILGTVISANVNLPQVSTVGEVPSGLPQPYIPPLSLWSSLIGDAISIAVVIFATSASLSKMFAKKHGYQYDANQDLFALGICQFSVGLLRGHACCGALARSSVQESSGGNTQVAGIVSSIVLLVVLLVIGPLFKSLPEACLSCIIVVNLHGLFMQFERPVQLWKLNKYDFSVWILTFIAVIFLGVDLGLGVGVIWSLAVVVVRTRGPKMQIIGRLPTTDIYKDIGLFNQAEEINGVKILVLPQSPTYVNKAEIQTLSSDAIVGAQSVAYKTETSRTSNREEEVLTLSSHSKISYIVLDCSYWGYIDSVALSALAQVCKELQDKNITVIFSFLLPTVMSAMLKLKTMRAFIYPEKGECRVYPTLDSAVRSCEFKLVNANGVE